MGVVVRWARLCVGILLLLPAWSNARGQAIRGTLSISGGRATDVSGRTQQAATLNPSVTLSVDPRLALTLDGTATRFASEDWSLGGAFVVAARLDLASRLAFTLDGSAALTATSFHTSYRTTDATPALEVGLGPIMAFGGVHAARATTRFTADSPPGIRGPLGPILPPVPPAPGAESSVRRSGIGPVYGAVVQITSGPVGASAGYREERLTVAGSMFTTRTATARLSRGPVTVTSSLGTRRTGGLPGARFGDAGVALSLLGSPNDAGATLAVQAGQYLANPLTGTPAGRYVSAGLSLRVGHASGRRSQPRVVGLQGVAMPPAGTTRLVIRAKGAARVEIAGDWNHWTPVPVTRAPDGTWYADLRLPPGQYRYAFRVDGSEWRVPDGAAAVDDGFGGRAAWITVTATSGDGTVARMNQ